MRILILTLMGLLISACATTGAARPAEVPQPGTGADTLDDDWSDWEDEDGVADSSPTNTRPVSAIEILGGIRPPSTPWAEMDHNQREFYMVGIVNPIADEMITEFDPHRGASFGCASCHGSNMRERNFAMPSTQRMPIPPAGTPEYEAVRANFTDMVEFMETRFTTEMGTLMGMENFSCNSCHPTAG